MKPNKHRRSPQRGKALAGVMLGLLVGVVIAVGVAVLINFGATPFKDAPKPPPPRPAATSSEPTPLPGKPGDKVGGTTDEKPAEVKPSFDFYKILPGGEAASAPPATDDTVIERLFVQAGAFHDPSDADNLKARLALMGMEASVQRVEVPDKGTLHRVRLGPYPRTQDAEHVRAVLAQEGIETALVRSKPRAQGTQP